MDFIADYYTEDTVGNVTQLDDANEATGQSFTGDGNILTSVKFYAESFGTPTGNIYAYIYNHSGTFGTSSVPTGAALATSGVIDASTIGDSWELVEFTFTGANKITLDNGTKYVVVIGVDGSGLSGGDIWVGADSSSPSHGGNYSYYNGSWSANNSYDNYFYVYTESIENVQELSLSIPTYSISTFPIIPASAIKNYRVMSIQGKLIDGVFIQDLILREITDNEDDS